MSERRSANGIHVGDKSIQVSPTLRLLWQPVDDGSWLKSLAGDFKSTRPF